MHSGLSLFARIRLATIYGAIEHIICAFITIFPLSLKHYIWCNSITP